MKLRNLKILALALVITSIMSATGVSAALFRNYVGFNLPANAGEISGGSVTKNDGTEHVIGVLSTKDKRDFKVRLYGEGYDGSTDYSSWTTIAVNSNTDNGDYTTIKKFGNTILGYGMVPGTVSITMKTRNSYASSTYFNGQWFSSLNLYNQLNPNQQI